MSVGAKKDRWVLLVDDDEDIRELLCDQLVDYFGGDLRIVEAADGIQASMKLEFQKFDCIVTDLNMPKRDGGNFIKEIKGSANNKNCPVIVVTGFPDPSLLQDFPNLHFIEKPVNRDEFTKTVDIQLKLGQLDKRLNANIFNYGVNSTRTLVGKLFEVLPEVQTPIKKEVGDELEGDAFVFCSVKGPMGICNFSIGFEEDFLNKLQNKTNVGDNLESVSLGAINVILKYMLSSYQVDHPLEKNLSIEKKMAMTDRDSNTYKSMKSSSGLTVPISIGNGTISLSLLSKMPAA